MTFLIVCGFIGLSGFVSITVGEKNCAFYYGITVAVFNFLVPLVTNKLVLIIERHSDEGSAQNSIYLKITIFRWINTVILTMLWIPFTSTLGDESRELIPSINYVLLSEMFVSPLLRLLDIWGFFRKHVLAPRARTQETMNLNFSGTFYNLGERYTVRLRKSFMISN